MVTTTATKQQFYVNGFLSMYVQLSFPLSSDEISNIEAEALMSDRREIVVEASDDISLVFNDCDCGINYYRLSFPISFLTFANTKQEALAAAHKMLNSDELQQIDGSIFTYDGKEHILIAKSAEIEWFDDGEPEYKHPFISNKQTKDVIEFFDVSATATTVLNKIYGMIRSKIDFQRLSDIYNKRGDGSLFFALCELQNQLQIERRMERDEWLELFALDKQDAIETLFQQRFDLELIDGISDKGEMVWQRAVEANESPFDMVR